MKRTSSIIITIYQLYLFILLNFRISYPFNSLIIIHFYRKSDIFSETLKFIKSFPLHRFYHYFNTYITKLNFLKHLEIQVILLRRIFSLSSC